ncbi:hypothetical protein NBRC110019_14820 [Neptunitalea chrysea]|uniref:DUF4352 domain-containing protein n=1 Tax=Neptunitalea chrysea TaxID=1647581 RepID=A0A9W6B5X4_9FLAO|nr:hypothetical protein [Neptunitalea chrysea]GLB52442.1 hypothetical protein NBRC110019_14820 [Neptunitalea chrysea]
MKKILLLVLISIAFYSCSGPLGKNYSDDTFIEDAKAIKESGDLDDAESEMLMGWILKAKLKGDSLEGKTYKEILKEAKDYKQEQEALAEKARIEEEEKRQKLGAALTVAMYNKGYEEYDYDKYLTYSLVFENKTDKEIRAFKGSLAINDLFDAEIKTINLTIDEPIKAGETYKGTYTTDYNQFRDEDKRLKNKDMKDLNVVWTPEKIIFADGTTLE